MADHKRVAVLISGRGSNMRAIVEGAKAYTVVLVASNKPEAAGLQWARERSIATFALDSKGRGKEEFDRQLSSVLENAGVGTIALAGFMRILSPWFVEHWAGRILNIHPSLLPKYRGLDTHTRAIEAKERFGGCSVHIVTEELDAGQILGQVEVAIMNGETAQTLEKRVLEAEHQLYPEILNAFVSQ